MAVPLLGIGMALGGMGLQVFGLLEERKERKKELEFEAEERRQKAAHISTMGIEKLHEIEKEKHYAKGAAKAAQASAGVKVGTGSALTQVKGIEGAYRRRSEVLAKDIGLQVGTLERQARELKKRAKKLGKTPWWDIGAIALGDGSDLFL